MIFNYAEFCWPKGPRWSMLVILNKRSLRSEGSGRAARRGAFFAPNNRAFGSLPYHCSTTARAQTFYNAEMLGRSRPGGR
jgi:hypothetical protein